MDHFYPDETICAGFNHNRDSSWLSRRETTCHVLGLSNFKRWADTTATQRSSPKKAGLGAPGRKNPCSPGTQGVQPVCRGNW